MGTSLLKSRKPSMVTGISAGTGRVVGNIAAGVGSLPGAMCAGVVDGFQAGRSGYQDVQRQRAAYQLVMLPNLTNARDDAKALSKAITSAKNSKKNLALSGLASKEYSKELSDINEGVDKAKEVFAKTHGIGYDEFADLVSCFSNENEFISTCKVMADQAAKELAEERKALDEDYARLDGELRQREQAFADILKRVNPGGLKSWVGSAINRVTANPQDNA